MSDFNYAVLDEVAHRPWPMPSTPWIMTQTWHDLLFAHWPYEPDVLRPKVPAALELDLFEGRAWLGIVPFRMSNVAPRGVPPLPRLSAFPELNVRTYVRIDDKPGVFFFSLDAANAFAVGIASTMFGLPYYTATMEVDDRDGRIRYRSCRTSPSGPPAELLATYEPSGEVFHPAPGTREHFLTERYCLYTVDTDGQPHRLDIHHPPWPLQPARATFDVLRMTEQIGLQPAAAAAPLLHFARRQDVVAFPMTRA